MIICQVLIILKMFTDILLTEKQEILSKLTDNKQETFDYVLEQYSKFSTIELINLTHSEAPWKDA